ncbi:MAG: bifunctional 3-(3-hydroxy-phenyl)propionate/3-hydroxycinnamic acid hydroxylase, partial [Actinomycetota bacterium]
MTPAGPAGPGFDADVIVIGCGPVGVMAALRCAQRGLSVIAIDRSEEIYPLPRALGMDDETQLLFERAGLGDELRRNSAPLLGAEFVDRTGERVVGVELPPGTVGSLGHPPAVTFDQPGLERALRAAAGAAGVEFRLGFEAFAIGDLDPGVSTGVVVSVGDQSVDAELTARWAIAADGAKSTVRSLRGIAMVDQGFDQTWLVIDTTLQDPDLPLPPAAQQLCDPARVSTFVPGPANHRRWEFQLLAGETRDEMLDEAVIWKLLAPWATPGQLSIDRTAVYRFHATVAERFRDGPVFLAGDAAHQMPPFNGQGMCAGLRDAENLSWKLAMVANGRAGDALLDSYDTERRPHAAAQVGHSVDAGMLMQAIAHDGEAALESGYGQRSFPRLAGDLFQ